MTIEEIKNLKKGDKFWVPRTSCLAADFQENILGLEITPFNLIEVTFDHFPDNCCFSMGTPDLCWFKVCVQGILTDIHSSNVQSDGFFSKAKCQANILRKSMWSIKIPNDFKLLEDSKELYPEWFI